MTGTGWAILGIAGGILGIRWWKTRQASPIGADADYVGDDSFGAGLKDAPDTTPTNVRDHGVVEGGQPQTYAVPSRTSAQITGEGSYQPILVNPDNGKRTPVVTIPGRATDITQAPPPVNSSDISGEVQDSIDGDEWSGNRYDHRF